MNRKTSSSTVAISLLCLCSIALRAQTPSSQQPPKPIETNPAVTANALVLSDSDEPREDWSTIYLAKSGLPLDEIGGVPLSKFEFPGCTRELMRTQWRTGDPIDLYVIRPVAVTRPPAILYLFDYTKDSDVFRDESWCKQAKQTGVAVVGFASALTGQRFHAPRPMKQWFVSELQEAISSSTHDVQMILNYLETRRDLDMQHLGMFGQGSGGAIAILAAAADSRICALEVVDPWGDWPSWLKSSPRIPDVERAEYLTPDFLKKVAPLDPLLYLPQLNGRKIRVEQVLDYPINPPQAREKLAASIPKGADLERFEDIMELREAWRLNGLTGWLGNQLKADSR